MFKDDYRKELNYISASEKFKQDTISLMKERQAELTDNITDNKTIEFTSKRYTKLIASVAIAVFAIMALPLFAKELSVGFDNTEGSAHTEQFTENETVTDKKDNDQDSLPYDAAGNAKSQRIYTINDAARLIEIPDSEKVKTKLYFNTQSNGGFGFEGYMYYSPSQLEQNPTYSVNDSFDTLPVYQFVTLSAEEIRKEVALNCGKLGSGDTDFRFTWYRNVYNDDGYVENYDIAITYNSNIPSEEYYLATVNGTLTQTYPERKDIGKVSVWVPNSRYQITLDTVVTESRDELEIAKAVTAAYPKLFYGKDTAYGSWYDYTFSGDINQSVFAYKPSENYGENIFNYSVNNIDIAQFPVSAEDPAWKETFIRLPLPCYTKLDDLPAITWQQALDQMYSGNYFTSVPVPVDEDTVINHIELVYLEPPYNMQTLSRKGCSVPFYKFFVDLGEEYHRQTNKGIMKTYGAYYVCAVHPEYIQLDDNYYRFN